MNIPTNQPELAQFLNISEKELSYFLYNPETKTYKKLKAKPNGEFRTITAPIEKYKHILKNLNQKLFKDLEVHPLFYLKPKSSYLLMIKEHSEYPFILTADIDEFYPSIKPFHITKRLIKIGFNQSIAKTITRLTTINHELPQGFPTSSALAALILQPVLYRLQGLHKQNLKIGLYADNLVISANFNLKKFQNLISQIFKQNGFRLEKFELMTNLNCKEIMNIVILNNNKLSVKKTYRNALKAEINSIKNLWGSYNADEREHMLRVINGKIAYVKQVNHLQAKTLCVYAKKLGSPINWKN